LSKKVTSQAKLLAIISSHLKRSGASSTGGLKTLQGDVGRILSIKDSVVLIEGLNNVKLNELVEFKIKRAKAQGPLLGVALNLEYNVVKALTFVMKKFYVQVFL
jgi:F0F1-type ATP synthase alpha subunit